MADKVQEFLPEFDELTPKQEQQVIEFADMYLGLETMPVSYQWLNEGNYVPSASEMANGGDADEGKQHYKLQLQANRRHIIAYKLLTARKWDEKKAAEMLKTSTEWREKNNFHTRMFFPSPIVINGYDNEVLRNFFTMATQRPTNEDLDRIIQRLRPHYSCNFHKWDKSGHPVIIELLGRVNAHKALRSLKELVRPGQPLSSPVAEMHSFQNELANLLIRYQDHKAQQAWEAKHNASESTAHSASPLIPLIPNDGPCRRVTSLTAILDAQGMHMGQLSSDAIAILKATLALDQATYPELMHRTFIVNCPGIVMFAYNLLKGSIDPRVRAKITFCSVEDTPAILRKIIDPENLPKFLGGECECEGGCVCQAAHADNLSDDADNDSNFVKTEEVSIEAGKRETRELVLKRGSKVAWEWDVPAAVSVEFSAMFVPDDATNYQATVDLEKNRLKSGSTVSPSGAGEAENMIALAELDRWADVQPSSEKKGPTAGKLLVSVTPPTKNHSMTGTFTAYEMGTLVIVWSNEFSWMKGKVVRFRVIHEEPVPLVAV